MRLSIAVTLAALVCACGGSEPSRGPAAPSPAPPSTSVQLRGFVRDNASRLLADARVEVVDGPEAGRSTTSDASGEFSLLGAFLRTVTLRASKEGHDSDTQVYTSNLSFYLKTLAAPVNLNGDYRLTIEADPSCVDLPAAMRTRTYAVTIAGYGMVSGATFFGGYHEFGTYIAGDYVRFEFDLDGSPWLVENPAPNTYLAFRGSGSAVVGVPVSPISTAFEGLIEYCAMSSAMGAFYSCNAAATTTRVSCSSTDHRLALTPR
jgi:hypothetical protein